MTDYVAAANENDPAACHTEFRPVCEKRPRGCTQTDYIADRTNNHQLLAAEDNGGQTDTHSLPTPSPGHVARKISTWASTKGKGVVKDAIGDMAKDEVRDQVKAGAKAIFGIVRGAARAAA